MTNPSERLNQRLGYKFADAGLIESALTHRSAGSNNNERLEFLGDAMLNFIIAAELYRCFPKATEGELSRLRASLVKQDTLAALARQIQLGGFLTLGGGELKSGGQRRDSILADALEAIFGAVYLDGGLDACRELIMRLYADLLNTLPDATELKDPKTQLQEYLQSRKLPLPVYQLIEVYGEAHAQTFKIGCRVAGLEEAAQGTGHNRRQAEQDAARKALDGLLYRR
ncbi:MAG: ribonuclease III [Gammaproteobacteria bacterium]|nr:ribonuclease III [Gammaproteobacteria bacterium]